MITGLIDGSVLICESWRADQLRDRWLVHGDDVDEFRHLEVDEQIRVRRASTGRVEVGRAPVSS